MSIQKGLKKGFTLIELMVVIVIIGILAAIAIPKLFGMSAKAKAQEVGGAAGTWVKLQQAYKMETGKWGSPKKISYKVPGGASGAATGTTSNFAYTLTPEADEATTARFEAVNQFASDDCKSKAGTWSAEFTDEDSDDAEMDIDGDECEVLTPNFKNIGNAKEAGTSSGGASSP